MTAEGFKCCPHCGYGMDERGCSCNGSKSANPFVKCGRCGANMHRHPESEGYSCLDCPEAAELAQARNGIEYVKARAEKAERQIEVLIARLDKAEDERNEARTAALKWQKAASQAGEKWRSAIVALTDWPGRK